MVAGLLKPETPSSSEIQRPGLIHGSHGWSSATSMSTVSTIMATKALG